MSAHLAEPTEPTEPTGPAHTPRRDDCPWCGSKRLRTLLPLTECHDCAHAFQNPCPASPGRPPYRPGRRDLRATARAMLPFPEPESWLDIGTGDAAFPAAAKELFPYTAFDGVDPASRLEKALAAGHLEEAYTGDPTNPHLAARLRARYDVVSVLHHLSHTTDPRELLKAALTALRPGGHLLLELPDPHSRSARLLGRWWQPRPQPRHAHLLPLENLRAELHSRSCTVVRTTQHIRYPLLRHTAFAGTYRVIARKEGTA